MWLDFQISRTDEAIETYGEQTTARICNSRLNILAGDEKLQNMRPTLTPAPIVLSAVVKLTRIVCSVDT